MSLPRRSFLIGSTLIISGVSTSESTAVTAPKPPKLSIGLITDLHYADKPASGTRHYRESSAKIEEAINTFRENEIEIAVELGDLIDAADDVATEKGYLRKINQKFEAISPHRHYVLGNHCVDTLTKEEFLGEVGQQKSYYSFDSNDHHFIILDSCFKSDGTPYRRKNFKWTDANIPDHELDWLREDLKQNSAPTFVFAHQRLDVPTNHGVHNQREVRTILEQAGCVRGVFQGHSHQNDLKWINQIPYCTCVAMVEGSGEDQNAYSILDLYEDQTIRLRGFRKQASPALMG